ncbi:MAG: hypothetical protein IH583_13400, partial [Candidatus Aminicenantes bacterium]|nr:hypothetical protein [Candidatus Aminicenantes bacterium]
MNTSTTRETSLRPALRLVAAAALLLLLAGAIAAGPLVFEKPEYAGRRARL